MKESENIATRAMIEKDGKVLLGRRARGIGKGLYALIGGKPNEGETLEQTIVREVYEETGLIFKDPILWKTTIDDKTIPGEFWKVGFFRGKIEGDINLNTDEVLDVIYVESKDLPSPVIAFNHNEVLMEYFNEQATWSE